MPFIISDILIDWKNSNPDKSLQLIMLNTAFLLIDISKKVSDNENLIIVLIEDKKEIKSL